MEDAYNPPPSPFTDHHSATTSEIDSLSDSDWLDISSSRESDDNDSLCPDSDHDEPDYLPRSRRSSVSNISSRDNEVVAWEGFVSDSADESDPVDRVIAPVSAPPATAMAESLATATGPMSVTRADSTEDHRVMEGLEQSMTSTLSASRSSAGTHSSVHSVIRDLRLSFPDPLTSSQDRLNSSYEDVSISGSNVATGAGDDDTSAEALDVDATSSSETIETIGEPEDIPDAHISQDRSSSNVLEITWKIARDFDIIQYGFPSPKRSLFVQKLIEKAAAHAGLVVVPDIAEGPTRLLRVQGKSENPTSFPSAIAVVDRTEREQREPIFVLPADRPSLAIVYLPFLPSLPLSHTFYLPVSVPPAYSADEQSIDDEETFHEDVEWIWDSLRVPSRKVIFLEHDKDSPIVSISDVDHIQPSSIHAAFEQVMHIKKKPFKGVLEDATSNYIMTFMALLSVLLGVVVNASFKGTSSVIAATTTTSPSVQIWHRLSSSTNLSTAMAATSTSTNAAVIPYLKDFAVAVFSPTSAGSTITPSAVPRMSLRKSAPAEQTTANAQEVPKTMSWSERLQSSKDLVLSPMLQVEREVKSLSAAPAQSSPSVGNAVTSLSLRLPNSLSDVYHIQKVLADTARADLKELMDALDELMRAIARSITPIVEQSRDTAREFQNQVQKRHARARENAHAIRRVGEQFIQSAKEQLRGRAVVAKDRARAIRENVMGLDVWTESQKRLEKAIQVGRGRLRDKRTRRLGAKERMRRGSRGLRWAKSEP